MMICFPRWDKLGEEQHSWFTNRGRPSKLELQTFVWYRCKNADLTLICEMGELHKLNGPTRFGCNFLQHSTYVANIQMRVRKGCVSFKVVQHVIHVWEFCFNIYTPFFPRARTPPYTYMVAVEFIKQQSNKLRIKRNPKRIQILASTKPSCILEGF